MAKAMIATNRVIHLFILMVIAGSAWAQSRALPSSDVSEIYKRLLPQIEQIPIFDHHAHPGFGDDPVPTITAVGFWGFWARKAWRFPVVAVPHALTPSPERAATVSAVRVRRCMRVLP